MSHFVCDRQGISLLLNVAAVTGILSVAACSNGTSPEISNLVDRVENLNRRIDNLNNIINSRSIQSLEMQRRISSIEKDVGLLGTDLNQQKIDLNQQKVNQSDLKSKLDRIYICPEQTEDALSIEPCKR